jgi:hypothetical protein
LVENAELRSVAFIKHHLVVTVISLVRLATAGIDRSFVAVRYSSSKGHRMLPVTGAENKELATFLACASDAEDRGPLQRVRANDYIWKAKGDFAL